MLSIGLISFVVLLSLSAFFTYRMRSNRHARHQSYCRRPIASASLHTRRKPEWVRREIVRLSAHLPNAGCRKLADMFNRLFAARSMTVSKTYVADVRRRHALEIVRLRRTWKHRIPVPVPQNQIWGLDATGKMDSNGDVHAILGMVDHGTRFAVFLQPLRELTTIAILRTLLDTIERYDKPRIVHTDNVSQFRSLLFRVSLQLLGIQQQFSKPGMPWMNGRIERLFGTLKEPLNHLAMMDFTALECAVAEFRAWYNCVRPHQHLAGRTPFEAWNKIDPFARPPKTIRYVSAWDGLLTGYHLPY